MLHQTYLYMQLFLWYRVLKLELLGQSFWGLKNIFYFLTWISFWNNFRFTKKSQNWYKEFLYHFPLTSSDVKSKIMTVQWPNPWNYMDAILFIVLIQILSVVLLIPFCWDQGSVQIHTWHFIAPSPQTPLIRNSSSVFAFKPWTLLASYFVGSPQIGVCLTFSHD